LEHTNTVELKNNSLTDVGIVPIIKALKSDLIILDISYNPKITIEAY